MITLTSDISLHSIREEDQPRLMELMQAIYPPAYEHLWEDEGQWYLNSLYQKENLEKELQEEGNHYYFIQYQKEAVGILRYIENTPLPWDSAKNAVKLHRIYLHPKTHGKGLGKTLLVWLEEKAQSLSAAYIWLDVMDTQHQAIRFYEKTGYAQCGTRKLVLPGLHEYLQGMFYMKKDLSPGSTAS